MVYVSAFLMHRACNSRILSPLTEQICLVLYPGAVQRGDQGAVAPQVNILPHPMCHNEVYDKA